AKYRIKGAILDSLRQLGWASRDQRKRQKMVEAITTRALRHTEAHADRGRNRPEDGRGSGPLAAHGAGTTNRGPDVGLQLWFRSRYHQHAGVSRITRKPAGQHVRARTTAPSAVSGGEDTARALPESRTAVLHQGTDHEGNRRDHGNQREPRLTDPLNAARKDGDGAALSGNSLDACV